MGIVSWLFGKPRLSSPTTLQSKRGPGALSRLVGTSTLGEFPGVPGGMSGSRGEVDGDQLRKYGVYIGSGYETITAVGDAMLTDWLGSSYTLYYVKKDTFHDLPVRSLWLQNDRKAGADLVLAEFEGVIRVAKPRLRWGTEGPLIDLSDLDGTPWNRDLIRQKGLDVPE